MFTFFYFNIMKYQFKEQKDNIVFIKEDDNIVARYKLNDRWREVNYSLCDEGINIRLFDKYKKYQDAIVRLGIDEIQNIP